MNDIIKTINSIQVTKSFSNCMNCGLPSSVCICNRIKDMQEVSIDMELHILMHEKELGRNTNTGRLPGFIFESNTSYYVWKRNEPPSKLISAINEVDNLLVLLYPSDDESEAITTDDVSEIIKNGAKKLNIVVVDGTWQESVKIVNRSPYLKDMKRLVIKHDQQSRFRLRRNQKDGNLCTSEAIAVAMELLGFVDEADRLNTLTDLFLKNYEIGRSGHRL